MLGSTKNKNPEPLIELTDLVFLKFKILINMRPMVQFCSEDRFFFKEKPK